MFLQKFHCASDLLVSNYSILIIYYRNTAAFLSSQRRNFTNKQI